ncbi:MAG: prepilin-type N-terminal cleavage/methylation domain-containing protein [Candidatus Omnitrophota bacterium]
MTMWATGNRLRAFTLIELLVVTAILGVVSLGIFSVFSGGLKVYERAQEDGRVESDARLAMEKMQRDIRNALPFSGIGFQGSADRISFALPLSYLQEGKTKEKMGKVFYYRDGQSGSLIRQQHSYPAGDANSSESGDRRDALADLASLAFSYYYLDSGDNSYKWASSWGDGDEQGAPPAAVRIEMKLADGKREVFLSKTVMVPVTDTGEDDEEQGK